jgi:sugar phosphate isomerase/epimerase
MNGQVPLNIILDGTDPSLVFLEMDLYWTTAGGADPMALLDKYKNRYHMMHVKDMTKKVQLQRVRDKVHGGCAYHGIVLESPEIRPAMDKFDAADDHFEV